MQKYYSKLPVVAAMQYVHETFMPICNELWARGWFTKVQNDTIYIRGRDSTDFYTLRPGQYIVFDISSQYSTDFEIMNDIDFENKYAAYGMEGN